MAEAKQEPKKVDEAEVALRAKIEAEVREQIRKEKEEEAKKPKSLIEAGPRYRTTERCYNNDRQYEVGDEFTFHGVPGHYMEPLNEEAKAAKKKHGIGTPEEAPNPLNELTKI